MPQQGNIEFVPVSDVTVNVKVTLPDGTVFEQDMDPIEGYITYTVGTDGQDGLATVEITFDGNDEYSEASATGTVELLPPDEIPTDVVLNVMVIGTPVRLLI